MAAERFKWGWLDLALLGAAGAGLAAGVLAWALGDARTAAVLWGAGIVPVLAGLAFEIVTSLRRGEVGLDIIAALAMTAALLMGETLAGVVVALMYSGGQFLESYAARRARRELTALLERVPRTAARFEPSGLVEVPIEAVQPGDRLLVRHGDIIPVDGTVGTGPAALDQSALTGESLPVRRAAGEEVLSGSLNVGAPFELRAIRPAAESTMAGIVRLVAGAERAKAPMSRLADRYAMLFLGVTLALTAAAWLGSGDGSRALAVLVIATPCPLILAVPIALIAGVSRAAAHGILVKGAAALEGLAAARVMVIDKTGTLTSGQPELVGEEALAGDPTEALRLGASLEQASRHPVATALAQAARGRGLVLSPPSDVSEDAGAGVAGTVEGRAVLAGSPAFVRQELGTAGDALDRAFPNDRLAVVVAIDGRPALVLYLADRARPEAVQALRALRRLGVTRSVLATGDRNEIAGSVAAGLGFDAVRAELVPAQKVDVVIAERVHGRVMMVGDGVNDAPALAAADVGVAMGGRGAAASAEAADIVLLSDDLSRLASGVGVAQYAMKIARQSVFVGIGLSSAGMVAAALGYIPPVQGALIQEAIDLAVILNALRALGGPRERAERVAPFRPPASAAGQAR
ncbi:heavy metal translocating P-type ATPase [Faunimonas sp. B44]